MAHRPVLGAATYPYSRSINGGSREHPQQKYQDRSFASPADVKPREAGFCQLVAPRPLAQRADESQRSMPQRYRHRAAQFGPQIVQAVLDGLTRARCRRHHRRVQVAMASSRRPVTAGPKPPMTMNTTTMAPAMKVNTPMVP